MVRSKIFGTPVAALVTYALRTYHFASSPVLAGFSGKDIV